ncbi:MULTISPECIES: hypothetical protein [unclassified Ensifer]|uniref:hypothetical protein n=1 Tax=unclassified Ensifer TaxID=2633371 RepID=UPI0008132CB7|nr:MULTISPECIES: hypothetical protein [unclassified Ensifer]OCP21939.1 hypothetical protein BC361_25560 [Ensifer sp. LC54]OCP23281.1 hypothetical protein BC363_25205 [Ensifer sp. LC384]
MNETAEGLKVRLLPRELDDEGIFWTKRHEDTANLMISLAQHHEAPVLTITQVKRRSAHNALPVIGTIYDQPAPSRHRSKRLWKKLRRKTVRPLYGEPLQIILDYDRFKHLFKENA